MPRDELLGRSLVALQFGLMALIAGLAAPAFLQGRAPWAAWVLGGLSLALGGWAVAANRPGNFNIRPTPRAGGQLVRHGPYRWLRHPMYSAVLGCGLAGVACGDAPLAAGLAWAALLAVLVVKLRLEERWMLAQHPSYAAYRAGTWRLLPGVY